MTIIGLEPITPVCKTMMIPISPYSHSKNNEESFLLIHNEIHFNSKEKDQTIFLGFSRIELLTIRL